MKQKNQNFRPVHNHNVTRGGVPCIESLIGDCLRNEPQEQELFVVKIYEHGKVKDALIVGTRGKSFVASGDLEFEVEKIK